MACPRCMQWRVEMKRTSGCVPLSASQCDIGEQCAVRKGARIGKMCDCPRGAFCNFFLLKCLWASPDLNVALRQRENKLALYFSVITIIFFMMPLRSRWLSNPDKKRVFCDMYIFWKYILSKKNTIKSLCKDGGDGLKMSHKVPWSSCKCSQPLYVSRKSTGCVLWCNRS